MRRVYLLCVLALFVTACPVTCTTINDYCDNTGNCVCTNNTCCVPADKPCDTSEDCCGNGSCEVPPQGGAKLCAGARRVTDGGSCTTVSQVCQSNGDCCSNECQTTTNRCTCRDPGEPCEFTSDCCGIQCREYAFGQRCGLLLIDGGYANQ